MRVGFGVVGAGEGEAQLCIVSPPRTTPKPLRLGRGARIARGGPWSFPDRDHQRNQGRRKIKRESKQQSRRAGCPINVSLPNRSLTSDSNIYPGAELLQIPVPKVSQEGDSPLRGMGTIVRFHPTLYTRILKRCPRLTQNTLTN